MHQTQSKITQHRMKYTTSHETLLSSKFVSNLGLCLMHSMHLINLITTQELLQLFSCRKDHGDSTINCCQSDRQIDTIKRSVPWDVLTFVTWAFFQFVLIGDVIRPLQLCNKNRDVLDATMVFFWPPAANLSWNNPLVNVLHNSIVGYVYVSTLRYMEWAYFRHILSCSVIDSLLGIVSLPPYIMEES